MQHVELPQPFIEIAIQTVLFNYKEKFTGQSINQSDNFVHVIAEEISRRAEKFHQIAQDVIEELESK